MREAKNQVGGKDEEKESTIIRPQLLGNTINNGLPLKTYSISLRQLILHLSNVVRIFGNAKRNRVLLDRPYWLCQSESKTQTGQWITISLQPFT